MAATEMGIRMLTKDLHPMTVDIPELLSSRKGAG
jgi:hypothetical protein